MEDALKPKRYKLHVLSHTHWDREWYQEFQGFRHRLVFQIDGLMDLLEQRADYGYYHLDGQTVCLEDYLEIRPQSEQRLADHIRSGRVLIGPWYAMPDELLLSGESLVRNLLLGHQICGRIGVEPMPIGYVSDIFGHCSQFPQIVRGFGMDCVFLHRGTSNDDGASEMLWRGADDSEVLIVKAYPFTGYNDFLAYREADDDTILAYEQKKHEMAATSVLFALEGNDHIPAYQNTPEVIARWNTVTKDTTVVHSSMNQYLSELKAELGDFTKAGLIEYEGELRHACKGGMYAELMQGTASSRINLKQHNDELEYLIPRCAEFLHACSVKLGGDSQKQFLDLAWKYLLKNHPHDSIVGCSVDQVHRDMIYRFDQARLLARNSIGESVVAIGDRLDTASLGESHRVVTVMNPSLVDTGPMSEFFFEIMSATVDEKAALGLVPTLIGDDGAPLYCETRQVEIEQRLTPLVRKYRDGTQHLSHRAYAWAPHHRIHVATPQSVPALGYNSLRIDFVPSSEAASVSLPDGIMPVTVNEPSRTIENEFLKLRIREDAQFDLYDKMTGTWCEDLHDLEDCGDSGDGWNHVYPSRDKRILASDPGCRSGISVVFEPGGALAASVLISQKIRVPRSLTPKRNARSRSTALLSITTRLTLRSGSRRVDCETAVHNTASGHRLRVLFPTKRRTDTWYGDSAFDLVRRSIALPDSKGWVEEMREETPIKNVAAVQDGDGGFAIITKGICEACVQDNEDRTLALTLFRSFEQQISDGRTQDSRMIGDLHMEYALVPYSPTDGTPVTLLEEVERYKLQPISLTEPSHPGDTPPSGRFLTIPSGLSVSTMKASEDGQATVLRLFNPSDSAISGDLLTGLLSASEIWLSDLLERRLERLQLNNGRSSITVGGKKIVTLRLE